MSAGDSRPPSDGSSAEQRSDGDESFFTRFWTAESGPLLFLRELLTSAAAVAAIGLVLFAVAGVWPPMVAVESGSMEPHMEKGDLVFVTEPGRFAPDAAFGDTGIVTYRAGQSADYRTFGSFGSVIVYDSPERFGPPIIHRARFHVQAGENWYDRADKEYLRADNCRELSYCPAPHAGFITKGDNNESNPYYDQASRIAPPVKSEWVTGVARVRVPYLGWVRLAFSEAAAVGVDPGSSPAAAASQAGGAPGAGGGNAPVSRGNASSPGGVAAPSGNASASAADPPVSGGAGAAA